MLPVYVSVGLAWEDAEVAMVERLLASPVYRRAVEPLARVSFTMRDVYPPAHWAIRGVPPAYDTPDEDVYLDRTQPRLIDESRRRRGEGQGASDRARPACR